VRAILLDGVTSPLIELMASPRLEGLDRLEGLEGPVIFAPNHNSHLDTPVLLSCLPDRFRHHTVVAAAADYFFDRGWKAALWSLTIAAIPVGRTRVNRRSGDLATALLDEGWSLVIYPEGGRSKDGWGKVFKAGAAYMSARTGAPVVPVHILGTRALMPSGSRLPRRAETEVRFGYPQVPQPDEPARDFAGRVEAAVASLADEARTDWWSARKRFARHETPPLTGPETSSWRRAWALPTNEGRLRTRNPWP
jgi:1-acyl-sn-glycerol-3-phosphate acyltransferase